MIYYDRKKSFYDKAISKSSKTFFLSLFFIILMNLFCCDGFADYYDYSDENNAKEISSENTVSIEAPKALPAARPPIEITPLIFSGLTA